MDIHRVLEYLPHRYPFLMIDRVLSCEPGKNVVALKNVTINEPYFGGHFPHHPVMPGVLIIEALAQAAAILTFSTEGHKADERMVYYFVGIDNARFKKPVTAGRCAAPRCHARAAHARPVEVPRRGARRGHDGGRSRPPVHDTRAAGMAA